MVPYWKVCIFIELSHIEVRFNETAANHKKSSVTWITLTLPFLQLIDAVSKGNGLANSDLRIRTNVLDA